jgi:hypothetical protein
MRSNPTRVVAFTRKIKKKGKPVLDAVQGALLFVSRPQPSLVVHGVHLDVGRGAVVAVNEGPVVGDRLVARAPASVTRNFRKIVQNSS